MALGLDVTPASRTDVDDTLATVDDNALGGGSRGDGLAPWFSTP